MKRASVRRRVRRTVGSLLLVAWLFALVVWNLPESDARDHWRERLGPPVNALALRQGWGVFAPNPTTMTHRTIAFVERPDGEVEVFEAPHPIWSSNRSERWRKWETRVRQDRYRYLWRPTAEWITAEYGGADAVVEVELVHLRSRSPEPGSDELRVWEQRAFFRYEPATGRSESVDEEPVEVAGP